MSTAILEAHCKSQPAALRHRAMEAPAFILTMRRGAADAHLRYAAARIESFGFQAGISQGTDRALIGVIGCPGEFAAETFLALPGVEGVARAAGPFRLVGRAAQPEGSTVRFGDFEFGAGRVGVIAGPCAVESREQILRTAEAVKRAGAIGLRGGAFKPRTNP